MPKTFAFARVSILELTHRVILTRSEICAVHAMVPRKNAGGRYENAARG